MSSRISRYKDRNTSQINSGGNCSKLIHLLFLHNLCVCNYLIALNLLRSFSYSREGELTYVTSFGIISLNAASKIFFFFFFFPFFSTSRFHRALGCRPPNLEAVAQAVFAPQHFSIFIQFIIADFEKNNEKNNM